MKKISALLLVAITVILFNEQLSAQTASEKVYTVEQIIENAPELVGQTVMVKGEAQHICSHTGRKLFLASTDGKKTIRCNAGSKIDKFSEDVLDTIVVAKGVVTEQRIYIEDLEKQEAALLKAEEKTKKEAPVAEHCDADTKAKGGNTALTPLQNVRKQKDKILQQVKDGKKNYLSNYTINETNEYSIAK